jgi:thymidine phosphorylase
VALITDMSNPLGRCIGNALETKEALELLHGHAPADLLECTIALGREMLLLGGVAHDRRSADERLLAAIRDRSAARTMERIIAAQGGDARVVAEPSLLPRAAHRVDLPSPSAGFVASIDAREVGLCAVAMGAGRLRAEERIDAAVGIELCAKPGDAVTKGAPLARLHVQSSGLPDVAERLIRAFGIGKRAPKPKPLVIDRIAARTPSRRSRSFRR